MDSGKKGQETRGKGRGELGGQLGESWNLEESKEKEIGDVGRVRDSMMGERWKHRKRAGNGDPWKRQRSLEYRGIFVHSEGCG